MKPNLLSIRAAAAQIGVCRNTMRAMIDDGRVKGINIARAGAQKPTWRVVANSINDLLESPEEQIRWRDLERRAGL